MSANLFVRLLFRCEIPECDRLNAAERTYEPDWLWFTTPYRDDAAVPRKCERFALLSAPALNGTRCVAGEFDANTTESCDRWVFEEYENTIGTEVRIRARLRGPCVPDPVRCTVVPTCRKECFWGHDVFSRPSEIPKYTCAPANNSCDCRPNVVVFSLTYIAVVDLTVTPITDVIVHRVR